MSTTSQRGSAMIIATIVVMILASIAAALVVTTVFSYKSTAANQANDEVFIIARAGLERVRRALYLYRAESGSAWDSALGTYADHDNVDQWNAILAYCQSTNAWCTSGSRDERRYFPAAGDDSGVELNGVKANYDFVTGRTDALGAPIAPQLRPPPNAEFATYLANPDAPDAGLLPEAGSKDDVRNLFGQCKPFRKGAYYVRLVDNFEPLENPQNYLVDTDYTVLCIVDAFLVEEGADHDTVYSQQIQSLLYFTPPQFVPSNALLSGGNMLLKGSVSISGKAGSIFANGTLSGAASVSQTYGAAGGAGGFTVSGGGTLNPSTDPVQIPNINPSDYVNADQAHTYRFLSNGTVTDGYGTVLFTQGKNNDWNGFNYSAGGGSIAAGWKLSGGTAPPNNAIYHFETDFEMTGQGNEPPMTASFIVEGNASMGGNRTIIPYYQNVAVIAGRDLSLVGTSGNVNSPGLYAAHEQVSLSGTVDIYGAVIAQDAENVSNKVDGTAANPDLTSFGNVNVAYDGGLKTPIALDSKVNIVGIRKTYPE